MTTFHTNTTDLNVRGRRLLKAQDVADARVWRMTDRISVAFARLVTRDPVREIAKAERREAARRAADNLLLR